MTALLVLEQSFFEFHITLGNKHVDNTVVLDMVIAVEVSANILAGILQGKVNVVQGKDARQFPDDKEKTLVTSGMSTKRAKFSFEVPTNQQKT